MKERGGNIRNEHNELIQDDEARKEAFVQHNRKTEPREEGQETQERDQRVRVESVEGDMRDMMRRVKKAIKGTKNKSAAGPDGISWRLLKMIANTSLGRRITRDVALVADVSKGLRMPEKDDDGDDTKTGERPHGG